MLRPENYSGSSMGNMPIGQGIAVTPMQMASAYTAIANDGVMRRPYVVAGNQPPPQRVLSKRTADQVSTDARGRAGGRRHRRGGRRSRATRSRARPAPPRRPINGGYSKTDFVASFIGFAPGRGPAAARGGDGRHAARRHLRRHGRRARLRAHHGVRAAVPEDPAALVLLAIVGRRARRLRSPAAVLRSASARSAPRMRLWALRSSSKARSAAKAEPSTSDEARLELRAALLLLVEARAQLALGDRQQLALALTLLAQLRERLASQLGAAVGVFELLDPRRAPPRVSDRSALELRCAAGRRSLSVHLLGLLRGAPRPARGGLAHRRLVGDPLRVARGRRAGQRAAASSASSCSSSSAFVSLPSRAGCGPRRARPRSTPAWRAARSSSSYPGPGSVGRRGRLGVPRGRRLANAARVRLPEDRRRSGSRGRWARSRPASASPSSSRVVVERQALEQSVERRTRGHRRLHVHLRHHGDVVHAERVGRVGHRHQQPAAHEAHRHGLIARAASA